MCGYEIGVVEDRTDIIEYIKKRKEYPRKRYGRNFLMAKRRKDLC